MGAGFSTLKYFLDAYMDVSGGNELESSLQEFAKLEGARRVADLQQELEAAIAADAAPEVLTEGVMMVREQSRVYGYNPLEFLVKMHEQARLVGPSAPYRKAFDVFISHSHKDSGEAHRIALELKAAGFRVWLDEWELLAGHNIADEVFRGIRSSEFLIVLLSKSSVISPWVKLEFTSALLTEIERHHVTVLPVKLDDTDVPEPLRVNKYVDLSRDRDTGLRYLLASLEAFRSRRQLRGQLAPSEAPTSSRLNGYYHDVQEEMLGLGWKAGEAFKDVAIGPPDGVSLVLPKRELMSRVETCRVHLRGWGGAPFPYDLYPGTKKDHLPDGIRVHDTSPWPYADWSFNFWRIHESGCFVHRTDLYEDHETSLNGSRILAVEWVLKDICSPLMFAHRLILSAEQPLALVVKFHWGGLKDRRLVLLDRSRVPLRREYRSSKEEFTKALVIDRETDLQPVAESLVEDLLWQFQWDKYPKEALGAQIREILSGSFPR